ncbi:Crp/Fnr family transcriptional regulator [Sphingomonas sp. CFBP 13603]|uniref:Crp/Fnr family transcriptional regulator n=1 Tax=Sphingomonas sp. CFBP 13603 TaxID=2774040 RepID=UPI0018678018|nr:Crp/Fnr family transcriptional regulator [Sphingomonas sp. CFBP 13603]MBE2994173.1 Crp/Fnr family transcriptional regulator [Sphingomonas sp. CFBP 13603]
MPSEPASAIPARCAACAARDLSLCAGLADSELSALNAIGRRRMLPAGQVVSWAGDAAVVCANLVSGVLKVVREEPDGRTQIVGLLFPGDFVGELFVRHGADTIAVLAEAELCVYPREALERTLAQYRGAERLLLRRTLATLAAARRALPMLAHARADARLAAFLLDMARRAGVQDGGVVMLPLSRGEIAEALGLAIETVSRHMTAFRDEGLIALSGLRGVTLLDRAALERLVG